MYRNGLLSLLILLFFMFPFLIHAAMTGEDIYKKHLAVEKKMEKAFDGMVMKFRSAGSGIVTDMIMYRKGGKSRMETTIVESSQPMMGKTGDKIIMIDDGRKTTTFSPQMGKHALGNEDQDFEKDEQPSSVELMGKETIFGMPCHKLKLEFEQFGERRIAWISTDDFLLVKEQTLGEDDITTVHTDYRNINGYRMPFKTETREGGELVETVTIQSLKIDKSIDEDLFDPNLVTGYKAAEIPDDRQNLNDSMVNMEKIMAIGMEIQSLYRKGDIEKAKALEKQLEKMTQRQ